MTDTNPKVLTVRTLESAEDGTPVEIEFGGAKLVKKIPTGRGFSKLNIILFSGEISDAELVTEKI
jgi:hypothetical protein